MSVDKLQDKIRKWKNPSVVEFDADISLIPANVLEEEDGIMPAYMRYSGELLESLKNVVGMVRFHFAPFALLGAGGLEMLSQLMLLAQKLEYYVLLDAPIAYSEQETARIAELLMREDSAYPCDALVVCPYIGADAVKPFADRLAASGKAVFVALRTGNKTAGQLQDLLTGSRLVHIAMADIVSRMGQSMIGRKNYSAIGCMGSAVSADSLRNLRGKYKNLFILVEGYDYSNANAKNCSFAFDQMGHGAAVCAGSTITGAWRETEEADYLAAATEAAQRMKKNLLRYVTVL